MSEKKFGDRLRKARTDARLSREELAEKANAGGYSRIAGYENGNAEPDIETLGRIAAILQVPVGYFFGENDGGRLAEAPIPYRVGPEESIDERVRRIVKEEISSALTKMAEAAARDPALVGRAPYHPQFAAALGRAVGAAVGKVLTPIPGETDQGSEM